MLSPDYTPEEYQDYLRRQYGMNAAAIYGRIVQGGLPAPKIRGNRGRPPSSHEVRRSILNALVDGPLVRKTIQCRTGYSQACVNKHLLAMAIEGKIYRTGSGHFPDGYQYHIKH